MIDFVKKLKLKQYNEKHITHELPRHRTKTKMFPFFSNLTANILIKIMFKYSIEMALTKQIGHYPPKNITKSALPTD